MIKKYVQILLNNVWNIKKFNFKVSWWSYKYVGRWFYDFHPLYNE